MTKLSQKHLLRFVLFAIFSLLCFDLQAQESKAKRWVVGSKAFTEGYLLAELAAQTLEQTEGQPVVRRFGMGGTGILFEALHNGDIDLYPEYTGTIAEGILKNPDLKSREAIEEALSKIGLVMGQDLGFNNSYAVAVRKEVATKFQLQKISDLKPVIARLKAGFSHEFMTRKDGYRRLKEQYQLPFNQQTRSMEHSLAYTAIADGAVDLIDVYTTDAKIDKLELVLLNDDRELFPSYRAVFLARQDFVANNPIQWQALQKLGQSLSEVEMRKLNSLIDLEHQNFAQVVGNYLGQQPRGGIASDSLSKRVLQRSQEHLFLVGLALFFSVLVGIPLGIIAARKKSVRQLILLMSGLVQTIPSLALLCFLIAPFGIGTRPALIALCLYGLLPVVLNTFTGLQSIDARFHEMARALGLKPWQRLLRVELPLASRNILAGIKTSATIGIGTATLAALVGAGGYGVPIMTGLATNDMQTILTGAVPAAVMAFFAHGFFELLGYLIIPKGLRLNIAENNR